MAHYFKKDHKNLKSILFALLHLETTKCLEKITEIETCEMIFTYTMSPNSKSSLAKILQNWVKKMCVKTRMDRKGSVSRNWQHFILLQPSSLETKWTNSWDLCFLKLKFGIGRRLIFCSKYLILFSKIMKYLNWPVSQKIFPNIAHIVDPSLQDFFLKK